MSLKTTLFFFLQVSAQPACMEHGVSVILCLSSLPGNCWCDMAAREPVSPMSTVHTLVNMHVMRWINRVGHIGERWFSGQPDSFLNYVDKVSKCQESGQTDTHAAVTEVLSHTTVEVMENLSGTGKRKGVNIWPCHLDAARLPADWASKRCSCGALWVLRCLGRRVMLQDTWLRTAGGGSSDKGQFLWKGGRADREASGTLRGD